MEDLKFFHEHVLYPVVRVRALKGGGSGTVLFSQANKSGEVHTFVLTNHHVITENIKFPEEWNPYLNRKEKHEVKATVWVDIMNYQRLSYLVGQTASEADIVAWNEQQDLALLRVRNYEDLYPHPATMLSKERMKDLKLFQKVFVSGCPLLHPTYITEGRITSVSDEIDNQQYSMSNASITFGNSGGAVFLQETGEWIGVPSRVAVQGWTDIANHMGWFVPAFRVAEWLEKVDYGFIVDPRDTIEAAEERRNKRLEMAARRREALREGLIPDDEEADLPHPI